MSTTEYIFPDYFSLCVKMWLQICHHQLNDNDDGPLWATRFIFKINVTENIVFVEVPIINVNNALIF